MDVEKILAESGAELTDVQLEKLIPTLKTGHETSVTGLKGKIDEFKTEKQVAKEAAIESKRIADLAVEEKLKADGKTAELDEFYKKKDKEHINALTELNNNLLKANSERDLISTKSKFGGKFAHPDFADLYLEKMVSIGEDGKSTFKDLKGNIVATNEDDFSNWLTSQESLSHVLKGSKASGGGANGGDSSVAVATDEKKFDALLKNKNRTHSESQELSRLGHELKLKQTGE